MAEGRMVLADGYPPAPVAEHFELPDAQPYKWPADRLYEEAMFHGPSFRGVRSVDRVGESGVEGALVALERSGLPEGHAEKLVTDFVLLDQPGQLVGFWASQVLERGFVVLPFRMEALHLYGPALTPGEGLRSVARIARIGDHQLRSTLEMVQPNGRVWARFEGWEDHRFDISPSAFRLLLRPDEVMLSQPWRVPPDAIGLEGAAARRIGLDAFPPGWLSAHGGLWGRVLAATVLSREERVHWQALKLPEGRKIEWLLGRIAAKDAVRQYVRQTFRSTLYPADIELLPDQHGRPVVHGAWAARTPRIPRVSISHVDGVALAVAADPERAHGIGIDIERLGRMQRTTEQLAFTAEERAMLDTLDGRQREAWRLRFWCAKEAAAKATGDGFAAGLRVFGVQQMDSRSGTVTIRFAAPGKEVEPLMAATTQEGDWIVATCAMTVREGVGT